MILYHGSYIKIEKPNISFSRKNVDFGIGFYTTTIKEQAITWSKRFKYRGRESIISSYFFDENILNNYNVLKFYNYSVE